MTIRKAGLFTTVSAAALFAASATLAQIAPPPPSPSGGGGGSSSGSGGGAAVAGYAIASSACMTLSTAIKAAHLGAAKQRELTPVEANEKGRQCGVLGSFAWIGYKDKPDNFMVAGESWQFYNKDNIGRELTWMCRDGSCNDGRRDFFARQWDVYHDVPIKDSKKFFDGVRAKIGGTFAGLTRVQVNNYRKNR